jgi:predicted double-glycine peptidase
VRITVGKLRRIIREALAGRTLDVPHVQQTYDFDCGASCLQAVLNYYGVDVREEPVMDDAGTDDTGTPREGIASAAEGYGLSTDARAMTPDDVRSYVDEEVPVIVCLQAWAEEGDEPAYEDEWDHGHYVVVVGYDADTFVFMDPSSVNLTYLTEEELEERWHDEDSRTGERHDHHGIAVFGAEPEHEPDLVQHMG